MILLLRFVIAAGLIFLGAYLLYTYPQSDGVTVSWDANTESDLDGYKVYYGKSSGSYDDQIYVDNVTSYRINNLEQGRLYYFAVTALDFSNNESNFSKEAWLYNGHFYITPNPIIDIASIKTQGEGTVEMYNVIGQLVCDFPANGIINAKDFPSGVYFFSLIVEDIRVKMTKAVILR